MHYLLTLLVLIICSFDAGAAFYRYVDGKGVVCYTDSLNSIPPRYRDKAREVVVKDNAPPPATRAAEEVAEPVVSSPEKVVAASGGFRWNLVCLAVLGVLGVIISRVFASNSQPGLASAIRTATFVGVVVAALLLNRDLARYGLTMLTGKVTELRKAANEQIEKDKKPLKPLSQVVEEKMLKQ